MEYLTIEEKTSLTGYLSLLNEKIEQCKELNTPYEFWLELKENAIKALDKIRNNPSLEVIEMRKKYQNTEPCKH